MSEVGTTGRPDPPGVVLGGHDPDGQRVVLTNRQWLHIRIRHLEMERHKYAVMRVVEDPTVILPDRQLSTRRRFYREGLGPSRWMVVVVDYAERPAIVVTTYGVRDEPAD